jgi:hypothetical protein
VWREAQYLDSDVIYLLGTEDTDPEQRDLDESCAAEARGGAERLDRGRAYFRYLQRRRAGPIHQRLFPVPGIAHVGSRMIESPCAPGAMFDAGACASAATR